MEEGLPTTLWAIRAKQEPTGFYLAFVPADLEPAQVDAAFQEVNIEREKVMEIVEWTTTSQNVAVAFIPYPPPCSRGDTQQLFWNSVV
jgi:hypothetical protein